MLETWNQWQGSGYFICIFVNPSEYLCNVLVNINSMSAISVLFVIVLESVTRYWILYHLLLCWKPGISDKVVDTLSVSSLILRNIFVMCWWILTVCQQSLFYLLLCWNQWQGTGYFIICYCVGNRESVTRYWILYLSLLCWKPGISDKVLDTLSFVIVLETWNQWQGTGYFIFPPVTDSPYTLPCLLYWCIGI